MEFSYALIARKTAWGVVLTIGLALAYYGSYPVLRGLHRLTSPPMIAMSPAPAPLPAEKERANPVYEGGTTYPLPPPPVTTSSPAQKDWTEYGDKIVGWVVALAGAFKLIQKAPVPAPEAPNPQRKPRIVRKKK